MHLDKKTIAILAGCTLTAGILGGIIGSFAGHNRGHKGYRGENRTERQESGYKEMGHGTDNDQLPPSAQPPVSSSTQTQN